MADMFVGNAGANRLANVLSSRMKKECAGGPVLDFGEIRQDGSLVTNTFPVPLPRGEYTACANAPVNAGSRVLVAWVQSEAVVVDAIAGT